MGQVYQAEDLRLHRFVALKFLDDTVGHRPSLKLVQQEARAASALNHPNICTVYDIGEENGQAYIAMEFLEGSTLQQLITDQTLQVETALDLAMQIADGLEAAHSKGIIHRDIKPANIFVTRQGQAKLLDFGFAEVTSAKAAERSAAGQASTASVDDRTNAARRVVGTVAYMSPEQAKGEPLDARTDLFSFGAVLYEMVTGTLAFPGQTVGKVLDAIVNHDPLPPSELTPSLRPDLCGIIHKALQKDRASRYQRAADLRGDLQLLKPVPGSGGTAAAISETASKSTISIPFRWVTVGGVAVLAICLAIGLWLFQRRKAHALTEKDTIVLADFSNSTGDPVFDDTLKTALSISLNQSPFLNVVSDNHVMTTLRLMTRSPDAKLTPEVARELCQRTSSKAYIAGSIASLGSQYVLGLKAVNCQSGDVLAQDQATAVAKEKVLDALGKAASKLRSELGESLVTVQKFDVPLPEATTSSLEALKAYSLGNKASALSDSSAGLPHHQRAIELDPNFARGYAAVGLDYNGMGQLGRAREYFIKAFQLRNYASERERLAITADYYFNVTGELDKAAQTAEETIQSYPSSFGTYLLLGGIHENQGLFEKATELYRQYLRLYPDDVGAHGDLVNSLLALQRFDEAGQTIRKIQARRLDDLVLHNALYAVAFLSRDAQAMTQQQQWFAGKAEENVGLSLASDSEAYAGHLSKAREVTKRAVDSAIRADSKETGALWQVIAAQREAAFGNPSEGKQEAAQGLKLYPASQGVEAEAALALALAGDVGKAESLAQELNKRFPLDTQMQALWLPAIRGQLAINRKSPSEALADLQTTAPPTELGAIFLCGQCFLPLSNLHSRRGVSRRRAGQRSRAEFQKILDHSGIVWNCWTGALARLGLARAYHLEGDTPKARAAYQDFFTLWKDADPEIPILKQAKAEYAKLR